MYTASDKVVIHLLAYLSVRKCFAGGHPQVRENLPETDLPPSKAPILINIRS